jgi:PAS domain-containing protein
MIERDLDIDGEATSVERRLDVACALVRALIVRPASDRPVERAEALALFEELTLPAAVFDVERGSPLANGAWRALLGSHRGAFPSAHLDEVIRTGAMLHLPELALELDGCSAHCSVTLRPIRDGTGATTGVIVLCALITDEVIARELAVSADALVWGGPAAGGPDYFNGAWGTYTRDARRFARLYAWKDTIHPDDRSSCLQAFDEAIDRGRMAEVEVRMCRADGQYRWHRIRFAITPASRWYAIATDIEDARVAAECVALLARERAARADTEQVNRLKDQHLAALSHELSAALQAIDPRVAKALDFERLVERIGELVSPREAA